MNNDAKLNMLKSMNKEYYDASTKTLAENVRKRIILFVLNNIHEKDIKSSLDQAIELSFVSFIYGLFAGLIVFTEELYISVDILLWMCHSTLIALIISLP
jgi:hypothetical protein